MKKIDLKVFLPVNYHSVVQELSESSSFKEEGHVQDHIAVP